MYYESPGKCAYCYESYYLNNGKCTIRTSSNVTNCISYANNSGLCSLCVDGEYFNGSNCVTATFSSGSGLNSSECALLHFSNSYCLKCVN